MWVILVVPLFAFANLIRGGCGRLATPDYAAQITLWRYLSGTAIKPTPDYTVKMRQRNR